MLINIILDLDLDFIKVPVQHTGYRQMPVNSYDRQLGIFYMNHHIDMITHGRTFFNQSSALVGTSHSDRISPFCD